MRKEEKVKMKLKRKLAREEGKDLGPTRKELKFNKAEKNPADISVAIDLSFDDLMTEKDLSSCSSQLMRIYTNNRRAKRPIPVHFTGLIEGGKLFKALDKHEGWMNWDIVRHSESFMELFEKDKIIYLTSESEDVLDELEKNAVYIIGGLVDHNHHKCLTYELALKNKIRTARLPLSEHLIMKTRTVLTINQVFDIVLGVSEGKSWKNTLLEVMPQRKNIRAKYDDSDVDADEVEHSTKDDQSDSNNGSSEVIVATCWCLLLNKKKI